jgi:hypothetical protein
MKAVVLLHGGAVVHGPQPLHAADENLVSVFGRVGVELVAVELVCAAGVGPHAMNAALAAGAGRGVRVIAESLGVADAHATGLVAARALGALDADVMVFAPDADPEGVADVPAAIAWRLGAAYVPGVVVIGVPETGGATFVDAAAGLSAVVLRADALVTIALPPKAMVGLESDAAVSVAATGARAEVGAAPAPAATSAIQIRSLLDLGLEPTLLRRAYDQRGVIEPAARPLVTTRSVESLVALLR